MKASVEAKHACEKPCCCCAGEQSRPKTTLHVRRQYLEHQVVVLLLAECQCHETSSPQLSQMLLFAKRQSLHSAQSLESEQLLQDLVLKVYYRKTGRMIIGLHRDKLSCCLSRPT